MKKAKERLDAEASIQMTPKQKLENFWFYYKWIVLGSLFAVVLAVTMIRDLASQVHPDYQVGLLTGNYISEERLAQLEQIIAEQADDRNGDGQTLVTVMVYQVANEGETISDPTVQMASVTRLSADIQSCESVLFMAQSPEAFHESYGGVFLYNDGSEPPMEQTPDAERMGVSLADCPAFAGLYEGDKHNDIDGLKLLKRITPVKRSEKEQIEINDKLVAAAQLFEKLTA